MQKQKMEPRYIKNKASKGELAKNILLIVAGAGAVVTILTLPGIGPMLKLFDPADKMKKHKINHALRRMQDRRLVKISKKDGMDVIEITEKGRKQIFKYDYENLKLDRKQKWDGRWRLYMFDIPQFKKKARRSFSAKLSDIGCYHYQKSVFISPFDCQNEIDFITEYWNVKKYIKFALVNEIDGEEKIKKFYNL